jgi:hypothetical protein
MPWSTGSAAAVARLRRLWRLHGGRRKLAEAGFRDVELRQVAGDFLGNYFTATVG